MKRKKAPAKKKVHYGPEGKLGHAEISIGGARIMLSDEYPEMQFMGPETRGGTTVHIHVYVKDVDAVAERAAAAGAKVLRRVQDVSKKEMVRAAAEMAAKASS